MPQGTVWAAGSPQGTVGGQGCPSAPCQAQTMLSMVPSWGIIPRTLCRCWSWDGAWLGELSSLKGSPEGGEAGAAWAS